MLRYYYKNDISKFIEQSPEEAVGNLVSLCQFEINQNQKDAWIDQIRILKANLSGLSGTIFFEYSIPRMGKRIDCVLIINKIVFVLEFKIGEEKALVSHSDQVWDYALDLKNFHQESHNSVIVPVLIPSKLSPNPGPNLLRDADLVYQPLVVPPEGIRGLIDTILMENRAALPNLQTLTGSSLWEDSSYRPTPTIIEAAKALYAQHSVDEIARSDASAKNLHETTNRIQQIIDFSKTNAAKSICFVTGVPGAGKTLVGLNVATKSMEADSQNPAVFLSGNGPLVAVLREALVRDQIQRSKKSGKIVKKIDAQKNVKSFIQNVHHFRDDLLADPKPPYEHVAIFDEAQRAWDLKQTANFMLRKKKQPNFCQSEPEFLIRGLDRHADWAVVVCLVGGGQEINTGEGGIQNWISVVESSFPHWHLFLSHRLSDTEYATGDALESLRNRPQTHFDEDLHLGVSMRSFRSEKVSALVKAIIDLDVHQSTTHLREVETKYPIRLTRSLQTAKNWIKKQARGTERYGLVASSSAHRLKPDSIDIRFNIDPVHWFLNEKDDTRSSYYLEDAATEFQVQGLELDWACVAWDGDLRCIGRSWSHHFFRGNRWCKVSNPEKKKYLCNAYRVLLTRARQGMVIYVPTGSESDPTRSPQYYDSTFAYLKAIGIEEV